MFSIIKISVSIFVLVFFVFNFTSCSSDSDSQKITVSLSSTSFKESEINDGSISESITLEVRNGRFAKSSGSLTIGEDYVISEGAIPDGLSLEFQILSETTAILELAGNASLHNNEADTTLSFILTENAFSEQAESKGPYTISFDFTDIENVMIYNAGVSTGNLGGRAGADSLCEAGRPNGLHHRYIRAFLSVNATDEVRDMPENYGLPTTRPFVSNSNIVLAQNFSDMLDGTVEISYNDAGVVPNATRSWTGSFTDGSLGGQDCGGFTVGVSGGSNDNFGINGITDQTSNHLNSGGIACNNLLYVICAAFD